MDQRERSLLAARGLAARERSDAEHLTRLIAEDANIGGRAIQAAGETVGVGTVRSSGCGQRVLDELVQVGTVAAVGEPERQSGPVVDRDA